MTDSGRIPAGLDGPLLTVYRGLEPLEPCRPWRLKGSRMRTKAALMEEWAAVVPFPPYFGGTWDAFRDVLSDLPEGGLFVIEEAEQCLAKAPSEMGTLLEVLHDVREALAPRPFQVLLQVEPAAEDSLRRRLQALNPDGRTDSRSRK